MKVRRTGRVDADFVRAMDEDERADLIRQYEEEKFAASTVAARATRLEAWVLVPGA